MADNSTAVAQAEKGETKIVTWVFKDWDKDHEILAASQTSCFVELGDPKVTLRFFLKPIKKRTNIHQNQYGYSVVTKWYSLYVEISKSHKNVVIKVKSSQETTNSSASAEGSFNLLMAKGKEIEVIEEFYHVTSGQLDTNAVKCTPTLNSPTLNHNNIKIKLTIAAFHLKETGNNGNGVRDATEKNDELTVAEASLINDLKNMFSSGDNYADLKLETKDSMTLSAHKFQVAARSPYFRKMIEEAVKKDEFDGTLKVDVNAKPMVVILHWMYTGELHENAGKVMEEVVEIAIKFELGHLIKLLDKKLLSVCNKENMFRLYQVAQKNAMPTAMEEIPAYIRDMEYRDRIEESEAALLIEA